MNGNDFVNGLKSKDYELYKKVKESINYSKRMFIKRGGVENIDYVVCQVCDCIKYGNFTDHLTLHSISLQDYQTMFPDVLTTPQKRRDRVTGENNPSFNHGGKYSPWSEKSIVHSKEQIKQSKRKAKLNHTSIRTIKYWTGKGYTQEQAIEMLGKFQARDLVFFINKYGEEEGYKKWQHKKDKWQKTLSEKTDEEKEYINKRKSTKINFKSLWNLRLDSPGFFYIIKIDSNRIKIGITSKSSIIKRYTVNILKKVELLYFKPSSSISHAFQVEQIIKKKYEKKIFKQDSGVFGWTEIINGVDSSIIVRDVDQLLSNVIITEQEFARAFNKW
jgi:hypothetical protein